MSPSRIDIQHHFAACSRPLLLSQFPRFARPGRSSEVTLVQRRGNDTESWDTETGRRARPGRRKHTQRGVSMTTTTDALTLFFLLLSLSLPPQKQRLTALMRASSVSKVMKP